MPDLMQSVERQLVDGRDTTTVPDASGWKHVVGPNMVPESNRSRLIARERTRGNRPGPDGRLVYATLIEHEGEACVAWWRITWEVAR